MATVNISNLCENSKLKNQYSHIIKEYYQIKLKVILRQISIIVTQFQGKGGKLPQITQSYPPPPPPTKFEQN